ncbi:hypothetical protein [Cyanobium usitatum]|uniref:hypothetical protein n=1 Tax=Cyanobium usitatum TaxID=2304190 RepID=UPI002AD50EFA|nr:hypothetical protein [Cyanobium usitatum]
MSRAGKQQLLNELQALTGYHRKSLLRRLNQRADQQQSRAACGANTGAVTAPRWLRPWCRCGKPATGFAASGSMPAAAAGGDA